MNLSNEILKISSNSESSRMIFAYFYGFIRNIQLMQLYYCLRYKIVNVLDNKHRYSNSIKLFRLRRIQTHGNFRCS